MEPGCLRHETAYPAQTTHQPVICLSRTVRPVRSYQPATQRLRPIYRSPTPQLSAHKKYGKSMGVDRKTPENRTRARFSGVWWS